jgi:hypothetical protein
MVGSVMRKSIAVLVLVFVATAMSGCFSFVDWTHNLNHLRAWNEDLDRMHRSFDRFFFNYDYDDPSRNILYEGPNT